MDALSNKERAVINHTLYLYCELGGSVRLLIAQLEEILSNSVDGECLFKETEEDYGGEHVITISFNRLETDKEFNQRRKDECTGELKRLDAEEKEKELYLTLKAKYETV